MSTQENFLLKEYEFLKTEIKDTVSEINILARYIIIFTGAVIAIAFSNDYQKLHLPKFFMLIPFVVTCVLAFRAYSLGRRIDVLGEYISQQEKLHFGQDVDLKGWEHYLASCNKKESSKAFVRWSGRSHLQLSTFIFWCLLLLLTALLPFLTPSSPCK